MAQFSALYDDALHTELGTNDTSVLFTTARRKHQINEGLRQFAALTECVVRQTTIGYLMSFQFVGAGCELLDSEITNNSFSYNENISARGNRALAYGAYAVQAITQYGTELYLGITDYTLNPGSGQPDVDDIIVGSVGARVKF